MPEDRLQKVDAAPGLAKTDGEGVAQPVRVDALEAGLPAQLSQPVTDSLSVPRSVTPPTRRPGEVLLQGKHRPLPRCDRPPLCPFAENLDRAIGPIDGRARDPLEL